MNIVVTPVDIKLSKDLHIFELVDYAESKRQRIAIFDGDFVKFAIVLDEVKLTVLLLYEEDSRSHGQLRWYDVSFLEVFCDETIELLLFIQRHGVDL